VTVRADSKTKRQGTSDPTFTYRSTPSVGSSLANGQVISFSGSLTRQNGESAGTYPIRIGSLRNSNYNITFIGANLTITRRNGFGNTFSSYSTQNAEVNPDSLLNSESLVLQSELSKSELSLLVYPNPFTDHLFFNLNAQSDAKVIVEVYDITGVKLARIFNQDVQAQNDYRIEYTPENLSSQILIYRVYVNGKIYFTGKAIHK
jgi:hypothetical protein